MPAPLSPLFIDARYIVTFVGTTNGVVECQNFNQLSSVLHDTYPNPGDPTLAYLLKPANWLVSDSDDMPYNAETLVSEDTEDYRIAVYRVMEVQS